MSRNVFVIVLGLMFLSIKVTGQNLPRRDTILYLKSVNYELIDPYLSKTYADSIIWEQDSRPELKTLAYVQKSKFYATQNDFLLALQMLDTAQLIAKRINSKFLNQIITAERLRDTMNFNLISLNNKKQHRIDTSEKFFCPGNQPIIWNLGIQRIYYYFIWTNSLYSDSNTANTSIRLINKCIYKNLDYLKKHGPDTFNANHNLAKLYYAKAQAFEAKTFKSEFDVKIVNQSYIDSIDRAYSLSNYYDNLLNNRQAWSRFSHALFLLAYYANDSRKKYLLDKAQNLIFQQIRYLYTKTYDSIIYSRNFKSSYDLDSLYLFQKYQTLKTLASLYALKGDFIDYFYYTKISSYYYDRVKQKLIKTIQSQNRKLKNQNFALSNSRKRLTSAIVAIILLSLMIISILLILNYILDKKNKKIAEKNEEIGQLRKKHEAFINCYWHRIKNNVYHIENRILQENNQSEQKLKQYIKKLEEQIWLIYNINYKSLKPDFYTLNPGQLRILLNDNFLDTNKFLIQPDFNTNVYVKIELFKLIFSEIVTNAAKYHKAPDKKIKISYIEDNKKLIIESIATQQDFENIILSQITSTPLQHPPKSTGTRCIKSLTELYLPGFEIAQDYDDKNQILTTQIIFDETKLKY